MAQYEHLNIYKTANEFLLYYGQILPNFNREFRYTIGESLLNHIVEFIVMIYRANSAKTPQDKIIILYKMQVIMEYISVKLRLASSLHAVSLKKYNHCCTLIQDIDMQLNGWLNYTLVLKEKANV